MRRLIAVIILLFVCSMAFAGGLYIPPDVAKDPDIMWTVRGCPASQTIIDRLGAYGISSANILCADVAGSLANLTGRSATAQAGDLAVQGVGGAAIATLTGSGIALTPGTLITSGIRNVAASLSGSSGSSIAGNLGVSGIGGANAILAGSYGQMSAGTLGVAGQRNVSASLTSASAALSPGTISAESSAASATASDNFNRADENPMTGSWTVASTGNIFKILNSQVTVSNSSGGAKVIRSDVGSTGDQYSQIAIAAMNSGEYATVMVKGSGVDSTLNGYNFYTDGTSGSGHTAIGKLTNGSFTLNSNPTVTYAAGDTMRITVHSVGTSSQTIRAWKNSTQVGSDWIDTTYTTGLPGFGITGGANNTVLDNWEGGLVASLPDSFTGSGDLGSGWTVISGGLQKSGGQCTGATGLSYWNAGAFTSETWASAYIDVSAGGSAEIRVKQNTANNRYFALRIFYWYDEEFDEEGVAGIIGARDPVYYTGVEHTVASTSALGLTAKYWKLTAITAGANTAIYVYYSSNGTDWTYASDFGTYGTIGTTHPEPDKTGYAAIGMVDGAAKLDNFNAGNQ